MPGLNLEGMSLGMHVVGKRSTEQRESAGRSSKDRGKPRSSHHRDEASHPYQAFANGRSRGPKMITPVMTPSRGAPAPRDSTPKHIRTLANKIGHVGAGMVGTKKPREK